MAENERKVVGALGLDIRELEDKVSRANELLGSIGAGVNLDVTAVVQRQVRTMLENLKNESQRAATQMQQNLSKVFEGFKTSASNIEHLTSATQRLAKDGSITLTQKGFDALNRTITDVYHNGELVSKTLKADSAFVKDIQYANELYAEQVAHLKRIYDLKNQRLSAKDGSERAFDLDGQIADTERLLDLNNQNISQLNGQVIARSKLVDLGKEEARLMRQQDAKAFSGGRELAQAQQAYAQLAAA